MRQADAYRRIDALLETRARDHPRRVEPAWSDLLAAIDEVAARLLAEAEAAAPEPLPLPDFYDRPVFVVGHRKTGTTLAARPPRRASASSWRCPGDRTTS